MIKRLLSISLAFVYLLLSTGFNLHWHFCHGSQELIEISVLYSEVDNNQGCHFCTINHSNQTNTEACGCNTNLSDTDSHSTCCTDNHKYIRLDDNQIFSEFKKIEPRSIIMFQSFDIKIDKNDSEFVSSPDSELILYNYPPPFLYFQQLRLYA
ncbi:MAG: hypothetical protein JXR34_00495 [Bacteroidales bacterium]|nr:hypothetical protein [Bacteroidales bacterium]